jgi:hypothetical protein
MSFRTTTPQENQSNLVDSQGILWVRVILYLLALVALGISFTGCAFQVNHTPTRYALVYGVNLYENIEIKINGETVGILPNLTGPENDAESLQEVFSELGYVTSLDSVPLGGVDDDATYLKIFDDINRVKNNAKPGDTVLFYFAGHGAVVYNDSNGQEQLFFTTRSNTSISGGTRETYYNARTFLFPRQNGQTEWLLSDPDLLFLDTILELFSVFDSRINILIMVDACFAGGLIPSSPTSINGLPLSYSQSRLYYQPPNETPLLTATIHAYGTGTQPNHSNIYVLAASGALEESWETSFFDPHGRTFGVFTTFLKKALNGNTSDLNRDGLVTLDEVYSNIYREMMVNWNARVQSFRQQYLPHISGGSMDLVLFELF